MSGEVVLVVAAHPDDEILGCGGAIARHAQRGDEVHLAIVAEGATSRDAERDRSVREEELSALRSAARRAAEELGASSMELFGLPDNRLDGLDLLDVIKPIEELVGKYRPATVYTHHAGDVNVDHRLIHQAVFTACRPTPGHCVRRMLAFEVPSSTEWAPPHSLPAFTPNWFIDISDTLADKLSALACYEHEMRPWPHPRSLQAVEHLARWRGASVGVEAAEGFVLLRQVDRA